MTLMKLKLDMPFKDLSYHFNVSLPTVSRIFTAWVVAFDVRVSLVIRWPDRRVKNAVRMRAFPTSGANLPVPPPHRNYTRYQNKLDSGREIKKSKLHTQKISLEFHEHKVY